MACPSTEFSEELIKEQNRRRVLPRMLAEYNKYIEGVNSVDQMLSYYSVD